MSTGPARVTPPASIVRVVLRLLLEPSAAIEDRAERRRARLLTLFLLHLLLLFAATNLAYLRYRPAGAVTAADMAGYGILITAYAVSRTRYTGIASLIMLVMFPLVVFANIIQGTTPNVAATLGFLVPGFVLASIFLSTRGVLVYGLAVNAAIFLLPRLAPTTVPGVASTIGIVASGTIVVVLIVIKMRHRDAIERDHQVQLRTAYDHALEGWARALELRDKETEGHSRRVTDLAMRLARAFDLDEDALEHMYRGALLHDIGKMAIPDEILLKNGPLDDDERTLMQTHTTVAFRLLAGVEYLAPALQVALCHHERWDGSGYPAGLRGPDIPLAARLFAVVDVWDALRSDRTYRPAWSRERVVAYLQAQRGRLFDPAAVDLFLALDP